MHELHGPGSLEALFELVYGAAKSTISGARLVSSNNLFNRYRIEVDQQIFSFDRYANCRGIDRRRGVIGSLKAYSLNSIVYVEGVTFCLHRKPSAGASLFDLFSSELDGGKFEAMLVRELIGFLTRIESSFCAEGQIPDNSDNRQSARTVFARVCEQASLSKSQARLLEDALDRDEQMRSAACRLIPRLSLVDIIRADDGTLVALAPLEMAAWEQVVGLAVSQLCEIAWHFDEGADTIRAIAHAASEQSGFSRRSIADTTIAALFDHAYANVSVYGGDPRNLKAVGELACLIQSTSGAPQCV